MAGTSFGDIVTKLSIDRRDFSSGLTAAGGDAKKWSGSLSSSMNAAAKQIDVVALKYVQGLGGSRTELVRLIEKQHEESRTLREKERLVASIRSQVSGTGNTEARVHETTAQKLVRVRSLMVEVTDEYGRQGRVGGVRLSNLVRIENQLIAAEQRRAEMIRRTQAAEGSASAQAVRNASRVVMGRGMSRVGGGAGGGGAAGGLGMAATSAAYGMSDYYSASNYGGTKAGLLSVANNLPHVGMGLGAALAPTPLAPLGAAVAALGLAASVALPAIIALKPGLLGLGDSLNDLAEKATRVREAARKGESFTDKSESPTGSTSSRLGYQEGLRQRKEDQKGFASKMTGTENARRGLVGSLEKDVSGKQAGIENMRAALRNIMVESASSARFVGSKSDMAAVAEKRAGMEKARQEIADRLMKQEADLAESSSKLSAARRSLSKAVGDRLEIERAPVGGSGYRTGNQARDDAEKKAEIARRSFVATDSIRQAVLSGLGSRINEAGARRDAMTGGEGDRERQDAIKRAQDAANAARARMANLARAKAERERLGRELDIRPDIKDSDIAGHIAELRKSGVSKDAGLLDRFRAAGNPGESDNAIRSSGNELVAAQRLLQQLRSVDPQGGSLGNERRFERPQAVERGNSLDAILNADHDRQKAEADERLEKQLAKLDKQQDVLREIRDSLRDAPRVASAEIS